MEGANGKAVAYIRNGDQLYSRPLFNATAPVLPGFEVAEEFAL